ncbi:SNF2-related protein [Cellulomonas sp. CW35]|uniref:SNF2-related protein n=1 Tax=Cellulomonas sp. CW35 TaxID=3458249 RepID=UPI0040338DDE
MGPDTDLVVAPGSVVVVRDEEWLVHSTEDTADGTLIRVQGVSELVRDLPAVFYTALDTIVPKDPRDATVVADASPRYRSARLWLESTIRKTPVPLTDARLTVSTQALADPLPYQQTAVRTALDPANLRPRILLADAVGLGKTLEIGMILSELVRRGRGERILVVTPRHVLEQMQQELWNRFALPFVRLDSAGIQRVRQKLPATRNPFSHYRRVIISIDTLKSDRYVHNLRKQRWDAVVIDESHNLTNPSTQNNKLARTLARTTEALILASATPHNGRTESFAELVRLLEPTAAAPDGDIRPDEVARLVVRRHRHSPEVAGVVGADWAERQEPHHVRVVASAAEDAVADELVRTWLHPAGGASPYSGRNESLFPWTLAKAYLSSPAALAESIRQRLSRLAAATGPAAETERAALRRLADLNAAVARSAKYDALLAHLRSIGVGKGSATRAVVFAERVATLTHLRAQLPTDLGLPADAVEIMHGGLTDEEQQAVVDRFKQASTPVRVLVTGDVASEGVNLHAQCHELVHYDIPWSLIRIEQRNGRIDRYGQKHPPRITTLLLTPSDERFSGDVRVLARLVDKEHEAHRALGDVASLMGTYDVKGEEEILTRVLAGQKDLDEVVRTPQQVAAGDDLAALFAQLTGGMPSAPAPAAPSAPATAPAADTGLFTTEVEFLEEALHAAFEEADPASPPAKGGVAWSRDAGFGTARLTPPADLRQRLEVLPQSYLTDRRVTESLVLATTAARGKERLSDALTDAGGSSWPDAHFLSPLHPVLEWAADRALARLGRNEVFAVRGPVDGPTVLLQGTLTNRRGQVVAASWLTVEFPTANADGLALVTAHDAAAEALAALGVDGRRANPGPVPDAAGLRPFVRVAIDRATPQLDQHFEVAAEDVRLRVEQWATRLDEWDADARGYVQTKLLKERRLPVQEERDLVESMLPDRGLLRPLLVVVPEHGGEAR